MSVKSNLPLIRERKLAVMEGEPDRVAEQKKLNKLTARERISLLFDAESFVELDALAGQTQQAGVVTGFGQIDGRPAYVYAQDFTVHGGAVGAEHARKVLKVMALAAKTGAPIIAIFDSQGARLKEGVGAVNAYAQIAAETAKLSGVVPQIALVLGTCAASAAMIASLNDVVVVGDSGRVFINGPQVVSANTGETVDAKTLGGKDACAASGIAHLTAASDSEAIYLARQLVLALPSNNLEDAPIDLTAPDDVNRVIPEFDELERVDDIKTVLSAVADNASVIELSQAYAPEIVTALAKIGGRVVGFVGTQSAVDDGAITADGCSKAARFLRMLDCFNIPVVTLLDSVGFAVADKAHQGALARASAQLASAYAESTVPRVALITGNAIAAAYMIHAARPCADMVYAWPGSVIAPLGVAAAVQVLMPGKLNGSANALEKRAELEKDYADNIADGLNAAKLGYVDDVIVPSESRMYIAAALDMLSSKRDARLPKKHGNLPL